jgi:DNA-binding CsgD family transcriptional regulator
MESHADPDLGAKLLSYSIHVELLASSEAVLDELHEITSSSLNLNMLFAMRFPRNVSDWEAIRLDKNVFLHKSAPKGWFEEWLTRAEHQNPIIYFMSRLSLLPSTWTEMYRILAPTGADRWDIELALKHGIRDGFVCPIGGRWLILFGSSRLITITKPSRIMLFAAASFAAMRLDELIEPYAESGRAYTKLTARERAVLRLLSWGKKGPDIAKDLGISSETVKDFIVSAKQKLGVNTQAYAVAKAIRQHIIV